MVVVLMRGLMEKHSQVMAMVLVEQMTVGLY